MFALEGGSRGSRRLITEELTKQRDNQLSAKCTHVRWMFSPVCDGNVRRPVTSVWFQKVLSELWVFLNLFSPHSKIENFLVDSVSELVNLDFFWTVLCKVINKFQKKSICKCRRLLRVLWYNFCGFEIVVNCSNSGTFTVNESKYHKLEYPWGLNGCNAKLNAAQWEITRVLIGNVENTYSMRTVAKVKFLKNKSSTVWNEILF